jgi:hypothetical protein
MSETTEGLLVLGKNQTLANFLETLDPTDPIPAIGCVVADSETTPGIKTLTCLKHGEKLLDASVDFDVLVESWKIHVGWHALLGSGDPADEVDVDLDMKRYISWLGTEVKTLENERIVRVAQYLKD